MLSAMFHLVLLVDIPTFVAEKNAPRFVAEKNPMFGLTSTHTVQSQAIFFSHSVPNLQNISGPFGANALGLQKHSELVVENTSEPNENNAV